MSQVPPAAGGGGALEKIRFRRDRPAVIGQTGFPHTILGLSPPLGECRVRHTK